MCSVSRSYIQDTAGLLHDDAVFKSPKDEKKVPLRVNMTALTWTGIVCPARVAKKHTGA